MFFSDFNSGDIMYAKCTGQESIFNTASNAAAREAPRQLQRTGKVKGRDRASEGVPHHKNNQYDNDPWMAKPVADLYADKIEIFHNTVDNFDNLLENHYNQCNAPALPSVKNDVSAMIAEASNSAPASEFKLLLLECL